MNRPSGHPETLRIGVFFDGTGNNRINSLEAVEGLPVERQGNSYANALTNVALLYDLYRSTPQPLAGAQRVERLYVEGVGTTQRQADSFWSQATGRGRTGVVERVEQASQALAGQVARHSRVPAAGQPLRLQVDLFGFSRGAAAARHLANDLHRGQQSRFARTLFEQVGVACTVSIGFIGLFDTVVAVLAPFDDDRGGLDLTLAPGVAEQVVHLVAGDEHRYHFPLVPTANDIVLPGAHSDVGGGYPPSLQERVLMCKPRSNRVPVTTPVEQTAAYREVAALLETMPDTRLVTWERALTSRRGRGDEPAEKQVYAAVLREREVQGHLSRVALRIMHARARRAGVPMMAIDEQDTRLTLPEEVRPLADKLHAFALGERQAAALTLEERQLLASRYIHTSANWNPVKGLRHSELDAVYLNRPAPAGRRQV
ncbi:MAG: type secretion protein Rhs [Pseudomonas sp.]|nr:type secretion protein Rhs [Pseudomonas sp.]